MVVLVCLFALHCFKFAILFKAKHALYHYPANALSYFQLSGAGSCQLAKVSYGQLARDCQKQ